MRASNGVVFGYGLFVIDLAAVVVTAVVEAEAAIMYDKI
jgi:hypothetical protein